MEQQRRFTHAVLSFGLAALLLAGRAASAFQGPQLVRDGYVPIAIPASAAAGEPAAGQSAPTPKVRRTVDELNRYRRIAGISPVVEDSRISVGCRRHAHYLVLNAGRSEVQGLG